MLMRVMYMLSLLVSRTSGSGNLCGLLSAQHAWCAALSAETPTWILALCNMQLHLMQQLLQRA
jgi:hypothetical protein